MRNINVSSKQEVLSSNFHSLLMHLLNQLLAGRCNVAGVALEVVACAISPAVSAFIFRLGPALQ